MSHQALHLARSGAASVTGLFSTALFSTQPGSDTVVYIGDEADLTHVQAAPKSVVYYTAAWCGPCKQVSPVYDQLSEKHKEKVTFAKMDIDKQEEMALRSGIRAVPTFQFFESGKLVHEVTGADVRALQDAVEKSLA